MTSATPVAPSAGELTQLFGLTQLARRSTSVSVGAAIVAVLVVAAVLAPLIVPHDPYAMNPAARLEAP